jgi:hypothetical protein
LDLFFQDLGTKPLNFFSTSIIHETTKTTANNDLVFGSQPSLFRKL